MTVHHTVLTCNNAALAREVSPVRHLSACHPPLADLIRRIGPCRLIVNRQRSPYEALVRAIAHQQLHGRAAEAILARLLAPHAAESFISPQRLIDTDPAVLRACGFSAKKVAALQDIAAQTISGLVPTRAQQRHGCRTMSWSSASPPCAASGAGRSRCC